MAACKRWNLVRGCISFFTSTSAILSPCAESPERSVYGFGSRFRSIDPRGADVPWALSVLPFRHAIDSGRSRAFSPILEWMCVSAANRRNAPRSHGTNGRSRPPRHLRLSPRALRAPPTRASAMRCKPDGDAGDPSFEASTPKKDGSLGRPKCHFIPWTEKGVWGYSTLPTPKLKLHCEQRIFRRYFEAPRGAGGQSWKEFADVFVVVTGRKGMCLRFTRIAFQSHDQMAMFVGVRLGRRYGYASLTPTLAFLSRIVLSMFWSSTRNLSLASASNGRSIVFTL